MMNKVIGFFKHPSIQIALTTGTVIIAQAYLYKKVLHAEQSGTLYLLPGFAILAYETLIGVNKANVKKLADGKPAKIINPIFLKPILWHGLIVLVAILSIAIQYYSQR